MITPPASKAVGTADAQLSPERLELRKVARAFEAIFVRQLLAAARAGSIAEQTPFSGPGLEQFTAMRDEHMAEIASQSGAFGLAEQIERQLSSLVGRREG